MANGRVCVHSLPQPVSMLMFMALVTIEGCVTVQAVGPHLDPCQSPGTTVLLDHADLSDPCCCLRPADIWAQVPPLWSCLGL